MLVEWREWPGGEGGALLGAMGGWMDGWMGRFGGRGWKGGGRLIRVIGSEAQDDVSHRPDHEGVPSHGHGGERLLSHILARILSGASSGLESVAMEMEGMFACVIVVEDDFYNVVVLQDVGVGVDAVDGGVIGKVAGGKSGVECRDFRADVSYVVEECARGPSQLQYR